MSYRPIVFLIHGFNVWNPEKSVGKMRTFFEAVGFHCIVVNYGHTGLMETKLKNPKIAKQIAAMTASLDPKVPVYAVGHSNGCAILHMATNEYSARINKLIYINPALKVDSAPGIHVEDLHVWHSPSDKPVKWAKKLHKVPLLRHFNPKPWGAMGAYGYQGKDTRVLNFNKQRDFKISSNAHSDVFEWTKLPYFAPLMVSYITGELL